MYRLGHYPAKGALSLSNAAISFDTTTGYTLFSNLSIDRVGMYLLSINIYTTGNEFSSQCYTNTITVIKSLVATNVTNSTEPNYKLRFKGDYNSLSTSDLNEIKANVYNYISDYNISVSNIKLYAGSVYVAFYSSDTNSALISALLNSGLNISSLIVYDSASINGVVYSSSSSSSVII